MNENTKKIKICFVLFSLFGGGAERITLNIANNLDNNIFDPSLILFNREGEHKNIINDTLTIVDLNVKNISFNPFRVISALFKLKNSLNSIKPDIVFSNASYPNVICLIAKKLFSINSKFIIRETNLMTKKLKRKKFFGRILCLFYKFVYPHADCFVAPSNAVLSDFENHFDLSKIKNAVIPNFIDEDYLDKLANKQIESPHSDHPIIISIGRLILQKNYEKGLRVFKKVLKEIPCQYWILGEGPLKGPLKALAKDLNIEKNVCFLGFQENILNFLRKADIFFLPSNYEGFPNALLEAMYCGLPCVITDFNNSAQEIFGNKCGIIADKSNTDDMADAIKRLLLDSSFTEECKKSALANIENYKKSRIIDQYQNLFLNLLKK